MTQPSGGSERRIVVGVDGSDSSNAALAWAVEQARYTGAAVEAVTAWEFGQTYGFPPTAAFDIDYEAIAADVAASAIAGVSSPGEPVTIRSVVRHGHPA